MATINPYLNFNGNCDEAFNFYKSVFGGEFSDYQQYKDMPSGNEMPAEDAARVMHVSLPIGEGTVMMGSDGPSGQGSVVVGNNVNISLQTDNDEETDRLYNGLSSGGQITMPLQDTFWGARFGMFVDKFGINWMINQSTNAVEEQFKS